MFRPQRRWSDDCLDSSHIPNEVFFGDVPVSLEVLFNYYDANAERERLASQAAHIAAQKAAAAKLAAAKLQARGLGGAAAEVTDVAPTAVSGLPRRSRTSRRRWPQSPNCQGARFCSRFKLFK